MSERPCGGTCKARRHTAAGRRWGIILGFVLGLVALPIGRAVFDSLSTAITADGQAEDTPGRVAAEQTREGQVLAAEVEWASQHGSWLPDK